MKNVIIILFALCAVELSAQEKIEGVYFWRNASDKVFNYVVEPKLKLELTELNAGDDKYYAMLNVQTAPAIAGNVLGRLAQGLKISRVALEPAEMEAVAAAGNLRLELEVLNTPNGPAIDQTVILTKDQYTTLKEEGSLSLSYMVWAKPLIKKTVEKVEWPSNVCEGLARDGAALAAVIANYKQEEALVERTAFKYASTKRSLFNSIEKECFGKFSLKANSFQELMASEVPVKKGPANVWGETRKSAYSKEELLFNLKAEL